MSSKKFQCFVSEPLGQKDTTKVPGITCNIGKILRCKGICTAQQLMCLLLQQCCKDEDRYTCWLQQNAYATLCEAQESYHGLIAWHKRHIEGGSTQYQQNGSNGGGNGGCNGGNGGCGSSRRNGGGGGGGRGGCGC